MSEIYDQAKFQQCTHGHVSVNKHSSSNFSTPNHSLVYGLVMLVRNDSKAHTSITRTTHVHDASWHAMPVHMCAMRMRVGHVEQMSEISKSSRTTTVESNMKCEHNLYSQSAANRLLHSVLYSAKRVRCGGPIVVSYLSSIVKKHRSSLYSIARLGIRYSPVSVHVTHEFIYVYVAMCTLIDIPEHDRHVRTYIRTLRE